MPTQDTSEIKEKILFLLQRRGPSLPVHIAREIGLSILFASAFLSELYSEKKIRMSNMKVGSSPIYFILGQEPKLENFVQYLKSKEKDAFILLKEKKILKDKEQDPAIRVALRAIKDFAIPFEKDGEIFWRYFTIPERELKIKEPKAQKIITRPKIVKSQKSQELNIFDKPIKKEPKGGRSKIPKKKEKSEFVKNVLNFLKENRVELVEEIEFKKREFFGIAKIDTNLGEIEILIIAKDKKKITENDLEIATQKSHSYKRMVLFISKGEINKKAQEYFEKYKNIIKFLKI